MNKFALSNKLNKAWYDGDWRLFLLRPLRYLYQLIQAVHKSFALKRAWQAPVPIIVVGNITLGGTGKTPMVVALIESLQALGYKPAVVSRGYKSKAKRYPFSVKHDSNVVDAGDEPLLIAKKTGVPVYIGANRKKSIQRLLKAHACNIIISDDGLQHYKLKRDIEICMLDGHRGVGNAKVVPEGPLREPIARLSDVDFIVMNEQNLNPKQRELLKPFDVDIVNTKLHPFKYVDQRGEAAAVMQDVHAVAGIGNPQKFFHSLRQQGFNIVEHAFEDHHHYSQKTFENLQDKPILMTEKDAIKCSNLQLKDAFYQPISIELSNAFLEKLMNKLPEVLV